MLVFFETDGSLFAFEAVANNAHNLLFGGLKKLGVVGEKGLAHAAGKLLVESLKAQLFDGEVQGEAEVTLFDEVIHPS